MKTKIILSLILAQALSSFTFAKEGGVGNGGETRYSRQFLTIAKDLETRTHSKFDLASIYDNVKVPFSIRPAGDTIRSKDGVVVDARSFYETNEEGKKISVTELSIFRWDDKIRAKDCSGLYFITLHELLVLRGLEESLNYRLTHTAMAEISKAGLTCDKSLLNYEEAEKSEIVFWAPFDRVTAVGNDYIQGSVIYATNFFRDGGVDQDFAGEPGTPSGEHFEVRFLGALSSDCRRQAELLLMSGRDDMILMFTVPAPAIRLKDSQVQVYGPIAKCSLSENRTK